MKTYSISEAKASLEADADEAIAGELVFLVRDSQLPEITTCDPTESIPMRPADWLEEMYPAPDEIARVNSMPADGFNAVCKA